MLQGATKRLDGKQAEAYENARWDADGGSDSYEEYVKRTGAFWPKLG